MRDPFSYTKAPRVISPVAIGATGVGQTGKVVDRTFGETNAFQGVEFVYSYGAITATSAVFTQTIVEGDTTGAMVAVGATAIQGANLGPGATSARVSGVSKNTTRRVGYLGLKRYVSSNVKSTVTAGTLISVVALLSNPDIAPTTT